MPSPRELAEIKTILMRFAERTGLLEGTGVAKRYLWTDAFAVCAFLSLFRAAEDDTCLDLAIRLIHQVHESLGRHRPDDTRSGWISGLDEAEGSLHPTAGGLRIGKRLNERLAGQAPDEREEWDRDGQYFHYLTKWMHALERAAIITADVTYCRWALELAQTAAAAFVYRARQDGVKRMYWKMSIDLSRPLVLSMGHHDPLDALVTYSELEHCRSSHFAAAGLPGLEGPISDAAAMCAERSFITDDPLGIGGLLVDALRISLLQSEGATISAAMLAGLLSDAGSGLSVFTGSYPLHASAENRLAFRELGLSIGLHAVESMHRRFAGRRGPLTVDASTALQSLARFAAVGGGIETFWRNPANQANSTWRDHADINSVMLATSLLPGEFLMV